MSARVQFLRLAISTVCCILTAAVVCAGFPGTELFLPSVGAKPGVAPAVWYTTVWVHNPGTTPADVTFYLLERQANLAPLTYTDTIQPGDTAKYEDAVQLLFNRQTFGALRLTSSVKVIASSRIYSQSGALADSVGQFFAGTPASFAIGAGQSTELLGVYSTLPAADSTFRYNFGFVETTGTGTCEVWVTVKDATGAELGAGIYTVRQWEQVQKAFASEFPSLSTDNARLTVEVRSGTGKVIAFGSGVANGSQDPATFEMGFRDELLAENGTGGAITGVTAGAGLTGGGTTGDVTVNVGAGDGVAVGADTVGIADGGVTATKIAAGQVVKSVNGLQDTVTLAAGSNVTITPSGQTLTIAATPGGGGGDITAVTTAAGSGLTGGVASGDANLAIANGGVTSAMVADTTITTADLADAAVTTAKLSPSGGANGKVLKHNGAAVVWGDDQAGGLVLPYAGSGSSGSDLFAVTNGGAGAAVLGSSSGGSGLAGVGVTGVEGTGSYVGGYFHSPSGGQALVAGVDGINASGAKGGIFQSSGGGHAEVATSLYGIDASGVSAGIRASGEDYGGYFLASSGESYAMVGNGSVGIRAVGQYAGGIFYGPIGSGHATLGSGDIGIDASGSESGGEFGNADSLDHATLAPAGYGINTWGSVAGGTFHSGPGDSNWADTATGDGYKIHGSGIVGFVQNHPYDPGRVVNYVCPEGDEAAVYTRGTARLVDGEARVALGETFQWVANPDLGLTVHLTPRGECNGLYAVSVSTTELVVKELNDGHGNATFDYLVYGLRIGFEEITIVQEKLKESYIPSLASHRERYAASPDLRAYNALERFKVMEAAVRDVPAASLDLSRATALKDAVHEYDPVTDPPAEELLGLGPGPSSLDRPRPPAREPSPGSSAAGAVPRPSGGHPGDLEPPAPAQPANASPFEPRTVLPSFPVSEAVETGDVVVMDPAREGSLVRCSLPADPLVVGIAAGPGGDPVGGRPEEGAAAQPRVRVATTGVVLCKVDASFGPIHRGDLLVTSPTPGHAMRVQDPQPGTVIGKALEPLEVGTGAVKAFVIFR